MDSKEKNIQKKDSGGKPLLSSDYNTCIYCGAIMPEGRLVCPKCEDDFYTTRCIFCNSRIQPSSTVCQNCLNIKKENR